MRRHPHLYEVATVPWLAELAGEGGSPTRLGDVPAVEWDRLAGLGFDLVWLMGVWRRSARGRGLAMAEEPLLRAYDQALPGWTESDVCGSPYAVAGYEPDRLVGNWEDLAHARRELRARGMGLVLDLVPNHTAVDHPWVRRTPSHYVLGSAADHRREPNAFAEVDTDGGPAYVACGRDPYFPPWRDTAQLDVWRAPTRAALIDQLAKLAEVCDGVRCDMAMLLLNDVFARTWEARSAGSRPATELWAEARARVPDLILVAEAYWGTGAKLRELGFDFVYDKETYDALREGSGARVRERLALPAAHLVRFLENHDEPRAETAFGAEQHAAAAILLCTMPGLRFIHHGQMDGRTVRLPVQLRRGPREAPRAAVRRHYERLLAIASHSVLHEGVMRPVEIRPAFDATHEGLVAFLWSLGREHRLVVVNLHDRHGQAHLPLPGAAVAGVVHRLEDLLDGRLYDRAGAELVAPGLHVLLGPHRGHVLSWRT